MAKKKIKYLVLMCTLRFGVNIIGLPEVVELYSIFVPYEQVGNQNQKFYKQRFHN